MKKYMLLFMSILPMILFISCSNSSSYHQDKDQKVPMVKDTTMARQTDSKEAPHKKKVQIPEELAFIENKKAITYLLNCEEYYINYEKAVEGNDMKLFLELSEVSTNLTKEFSTIKPELTKEEYGKIRVYTLKVAKKLNKLSKRMY